jgi:DNA-binding response OmpR family regulator
LTVDALEEIRVSNFSLNFSERMLIHGHQPPVKLTNLELRLLHLLMGHSPRTVSYDEIIHHVWGSLSDADYAALKNVVYRLRLKIEANPNEPRYLVTLPGVGYKFDPARE